MTSSCPEGKCDGFGEEGTAECGSSVTEFASEIVTDSSICDAFAERGLLADGQAGFDASGNLLDAVTQWRTPYGSDVLGCHAYGEQGHVAFTDDELRDLVAEDPQTDTLKDQCDRLTIAHLRCLGEIPRDVTYDDGEENGLDPVPEASCDDTSTCHPGRELGCVRYVPPWAADGTAGRHPLPQTLCTGQTVNGLGYVQHAPYELDYGEACSGSDTGNEITTCNALGQTFDADVGFCDVLRCCVEPGLVEMGAIDGTASGKDQIYEFPSGRFALSIDNACSGGSNHAPGRCRAVDINAQYNGGNLGSVIHKDDGTDEIRGGGGNMHDPEVNLPPAFVALMEECGLFWGGRFPAALPSNQTGADPRDRAVPGWCDPMHFDYVPDCVVDEAERARLYDDVCSN